MLCVAKCRYAWWIFHSWITTAAFAWKNWRNVWRTQNKASKSIQNSCTFQIRTTCASHSIATLCNMTVAIVTAICRERSHRSDDVRKLNCQCDNYNPFPVHSQTHSWQNAIILNTPSDFYEHKLSTAGYKSQLNLTQVSPHEINSIL